MESGKVLCWPDFGKTGTDIEDTGGHRRHLSLKAHGRFKEGNQHGAGKDDEGENDDIDHYRLLFPGGKALAVDFERTDHPGTVGFFNMLGGYLERDDEPDNLGPSGCGA